MKWDNNPFKYKEEIVFLTNSPLYLIVVLLYKILGRNKIPLESIKSEEIHYTAIPDTTIIPFYVFVTLLVYKHNTVQIPYNHPLHDRPVNENRHTLC